MRRIGKVRERKRKMSKVRERKKGSNESRICGLCGSCPRKIIKFLFLRNNPK